MDWLAVLQYVSALVLEAHRKGNPFINMLEYGAPRGTSWRLRPFLQEKQASVIFGDGDSGKSWIALYIGVLVATGLVLDGLMHIQARRRPLFGLRDG